MIKSRDSDATHRKEPGDITSGYGRNRKSSIYGVPLMCDPLVFYHSHIHDSNCMSVYCFNKMCCLILHHEELFSLLHVRWSMTDYIICRSLQQLDAHYLWSWCERPLHMVVEFILSVWFNTTIWLLTLGYFCQALTILFKKDYYWCLLYLFFLHWTFNFISIIFHLFLSFCAHFTTLDKYLCCLISATPILFTHIDWRC